MQETKTIRVKKCPYCFRNISNEDAGFLLRTDGVRFQSPALNEVFSYKTDTAYLYFWSAMGIPEERILKEKKSKTTAENIKYSKKFIKSKESVGIVTNNFHM